MGTFLFLGIWATSPLGTSIHNLHRIISYGRIHKNEYFPFLQIIIAIYYQQNQTALLQQYLHLYSIYSFPCFGHTSPDGTSQQLPQINSFGSNWFFSSSYQIIEDRIFPNTIAL